MVYTKAIPIHGVKHLSQLEKYIEDAMKTTIDGETSHLDHLFNYIANENKTMSKQLYSGYQIIDINNASKEFLLTKETMSKQKGTDIEFNPKTEKMEWKQANIENGGGKGKPVLGYHLIQSFSPDDNLTPEQVHEIGRKTILEFTGGEYEFVIATHNDKDHLHNHIFVNSTNMVTGKSMRWEKPQRKDGTTWNKTKEEFEQVSDKIASKYGAKIITKSPKNSHKKYTKWQTETIYKSKIKSRLDFLLEHSSDINDFIEKATALHVSVDFSKKWSTFRLLDEPQIKNTRGRNLSKRDPEKYNLDRIEQRLKENEGIFSIDDVVERYEEKEQAIKNDFDYMVKLESWQIDHVTSKGIYLTIDTGVTERGQLFIGGYKLDPLENGEYNFYFKRSDMFYFMNEKNSTKNKYMTGETLLKQLKLYNGTIPLRKEPVISKLDDIIAAINFLAEHGVNDSKQMVQLETKLERSLKEAEAKLKELDQKIIDLNQLSKEILTGELKNQRSTECALSLDEIKEEVKAVKLSKEILQNTFNDIVKDLEYYREIRAESEKELGTEKNYRL